MQIEHTAGDCALILVPGPCKGGCCRDRFQIAEAVSVMDAVLGDNEKTLVVDGKTYRTIGDKRSKWDKDRLIGEVGALASEAKKAKAREARKARKEKDRAQADLDTMLRDIGVTSLESVVVTETVSVSRAA